MGSFSPEELYYNISVATHQLKIRCKYRFRDCYFTVWGNTREQWNQELDEFLYPYLWRFFYLPKNKQSNSWNIYLIPVNENNFLVPPEKFVTYNVNGQNLTLLRETSGTITVTNIKKRERYHIYSATVKIRWLVQDIYCGIRRIIHLHLQDSGVVLFHAASFQWRKKCFLVMGSKGAGKTFFTNYALLFKDAAFISSDKTLVWIEDERLFASGLIAAYRVDPADQKKFPDNLKSTKLFSMAHLMSKDKNNILASKVNMTPMQFSRVTRKKIVRICNPQIVISLENGDRAEINEEISAVYAIQKIRSNVITDVSLDLQIDNDRREKDEEINNKRVLEKVLSSCKIVSVKGKLDLAMINSLVDCLFMKTELQ